MQNKKRKFIIALVFSIFIVFSLVAVVDAQGLEDAFNNAGTVADAGGYKIGETAAAENIIAKIINTVLSMLGVLFLILMLYGGYLWMTAAGKEERVTKAKNLITAAIIGVIIVVSAYAISYFVIKKVTTKVLDDGSAAESSTSGSDSDSPDVPDFPDFPDVPDLP
ncbi:hypothetical protein KAJ61_03075 [Candidatus Parcubacteria bacterium]|nr:hypothetical protein [Candidatus Parcubacteria bacterium]